MPCSTMIHHEDTVDSLLYPRSILSAILNSVGNSMFLPAMYQPSLTLEGVPAIMKNSLSVSDFVLARVAEDEDHAKWTLQQPKNFGLGDPHIFRTWEDESAVLGVDPARVLAECEAKKKIVAMYKVADTNGTTEKDKHGAMGLLLAVLASAAVYKYHEDYNNEWAV